jgi:hypothetical protein
MAEPMTWWLQIGDKPRQGERQGQVAKARLTHHFSGNAMREKTTPRKPKRKNAKSNLLQRNTASMVSMATQNLVNMVAVMSVSGAVLLTLLAARHF